MRNQKHFSGYLALKEEMLDGRKVSIVECLLLFGVQSFSRARTQLKREGYLIKNQKVPMAKVLRRINEHCLCEAPKELPIREIQVTEYWISK